MATTKITITLPESQFEEIRKRVAAHDSPSVSGFIQDAVQKSLENETQFRAMVEEAMKKSGGPLKTKERTWARRILKARKPGAKPTEGRLNGIVFDAGGLIALERNDRRVFSILNTALEDGDRILVPATALAQVIRNPARQVRLWRMIQFAKTEVVPLDGSNAQAVGALLAQTATADITDAHVVICAQIAGYTIITSDPLDLKRLNPRLRLITV